VEFVVVFGAYNQDPIERFALLVNIRFSYQYNQFGSNFINRIWNTKNMLVSVSMIQLIAILHCV